jgi:hypothetical protein
MSKYIWIAKADFEYLINEAKKGNKFITCPEVANVKPKMLYEEDNDKYIQLRMMPKKRNLNE